MGRIRPALEAIGVCLVGGRGGRAVVRRWLIDRRGRIAEAAVAALLGRVVV